MTGNMKKKYVEMTPEVQKEIDILKKQSKILRDAIINSEIDIYNKIRLFEVYNLGVIDVYYIEFDVILPKHHSYFKWLNDYELNRREVFHFTTLVEDIEMDETQSKEVIKSALEELFNFVINEDIIGFRYDW